MLVLESSNVMKIILRFLALVLAGAMLFMGVETLLPQFPDFMSQFTAMVFVFVGGYLAFYGVTGRSSLLGRSN